MTKQYEQKCRDLENKNDVAEHIVYLHKKNPDNHDFMDLLDIAHRIWVRSAPMEAPKRVAPATPVEPIYELEPVKSLVLSETEYYAMVFKQHNFRLDNPKSFPCAYCAMVDAGIKPSAEQINLAKKICVERRFKSYKVYLEETKSVSI
jgi:hypothetical protein